MSALIDSLAEEAFAREVEQTARVRTPQLLPLEDRVVFVTGAASGLGAAIARDLVEQGARVVLADINRLKAGQHAESIDPRGERSLVVTCDVSDAEDCVAAIERSVSHFGTIDALVNNAGTDVTCAIGDLSVADFDRVLSTNLRGPFLLIKAALPALIDGYDGEGGQIVNIASTAARRAWPNASAYHASKWGLLGLTQSIHAELRARGVRVTSVIAGGMRTPFLLDRFSDLDPALLQDPANVALGVRFALTMPRGSVVPELMVLPQNETSWP
ncbi:SDR family oxidoreductase [Caldimonas sp. KR1-144]|uniref:SDR family oxidoreductase n=1 Tax=Caldimonas sp. KR1-144 TaxID=3400911 RepID=UPI003C0A1329